MNKINKIGILALLLVAVMLVAGCIGSKEVPPNLGTLSAAIASGEDYMCSVSTTDLEEGYTSAMVVWVKGNDMRIEYKDNQGNEFYQIMKDDTAWWWDPVQKTGMKVDIPKESEVEYEQPEEFGGYTTSNLEGQYTWKCSPESIDSSKFSVPSDVEFTDLAEMMQELEDMMG